MDIVCGFFVYARVALGIPVVEVWEGVHCAFFSLCLCGGFVFCMRFLGCLVRYVLGSYLGMGYDMVVRKRELELDLGRLGLF